MTTHTVKAGDTLGKIAKKFYGDASKFRLIVNANELANPDRLRIGQVLVIPDPATPVAPITPPAAPTGNGSNRIAELNAKKLADLHPLVAERARAMLDLCEQNGLAVLVTQAVRTWKEQDKLYAQGRTAPGKIVTKAKGGQSFHNFGLAFDIVPLDAMGKANWDDKHPAWSLAAQHGKAAGLDWGGDWKGFKDRPHFQYTGGITLARCRELCPNGADLATLWAQVQ